MDIAELRRRNLRQWIIRQHGGQQAHFAAAASINQGELSSLLKNKSFGEKKPAKSSSLPECPPCGWIPTTAICLKPLPHTIRHLKKRIRK